MGISQTLCVFRKYSLRISLLVLVISSTGCGLVRNHIATVNDDEIVHFTDNELCRKWTGPLRKADIETVQNELWRRYQRKTLTCMAQSTNHQLCMAAIVRARNPFEQALANKELEIRNFDCDISTYLNYKAQQLNLENQRQQAIQQREAEDNLLRQLKKDSKKRDYERRQQQHKTYNTNCTTSFGNTHCTTY